MAEPIPCCAIQVFLNSLIVKAAEDSAVKAVSFPLGRHNVWRHLHCESRAGARAKCPGRLRARELSGAGPGVLGSLALTEPRAGLLPLALRAPELAVLHAVNLPALLGVAARPPQRGLRGRAVGLRGETDVLAGGLQGKGEEGEEGEG